MRANGHLMLNGEKMSKSTGNSLTLKDALVKFGADATRITLADAGDSIEDANFEESTANAAILRLKTLIEWCEVCLSFFFISFRMRYLTSFGEQEVMKKKDGKDDKEVQLREGAPNTFWDKIFANELNLAIEQTLNAYKLFVYLFISLFRQLRADAFN